MRIWMSGRLKHLFTRPFLEDLAEIHNRDRVREVASDGQIVSYEQVTEATPTLGFCKEVDDLRLDREVQGRNRLVAHYQRRIQSQRPCDTDPLQLPT